MIVVRPVTPQGASKENPSMVLYGHQAGTVASAVQHLMNGKVLGVASEFALIRLLSSLERTRIPIRIENEFGLTLEERWPDIEKLSRFIEEDPGDNRLNKILNFPYVSEEVKAELRRKYGEIPVEEREQGNTYLGEDIEVRKPNKIPAKKENLDDKLTTTGKAVDAIFYGKD